MAGDLQDDKIKFEELVQRIENSNRGRHTSQEVLDQVMHKIKNNGVGFKW